MKTTGIFLATIMIHLGILMIPVGDDGKKMALPLMKKGTIATSVVLRKKVKTRKKTVKPAKKRKTLTRKAIRPVPKEDIVEEEVEETTSDEVVGVEVGSVIEFRPVPTYPRISRMRGEVGKVGVSVKIDERGLVLSAKVVESSGFKRLDQAAREASLKASFSPAMKNGIHVASDHIIYYKFELK